VGRVRGGGVLAVVTFRSRAILFLAPVIATVVGGTFGLHIAFLSLNGGFVQWQELPKAPAKVIIIISMTNAQGIDSSLLYVKTSDNKTIVANLGSCLKLPRSCWSGVNKNDDTNRVYPCSYRFDIVPPPAVPVQRLDLCNHFMNGPSPSEVYTSVVLLPDGNLWIWRHVHWELENLAIFSIPITYGFRGFVIGVIISLALWFSKSSRLNSCDLS
jgi:hypothetical protein